MKITKKIELIRKIETKLHSRYNNDEIAFFLENFIPRVEIVMNRFEVASTLHKASDCILIKIAKELEVGIEYIASEPPKNWEKSNNKVKAFISHLAIYSKYAIKLRDALKKYNIDSFVAHKDIPPSKEWQDEISKALRTMDFFIALHTKGFSKSVWCQQEVGFAIARDVKIIPIKFDGKENPEGFIAKIQALIKPRSKLAPDVASEIVELLKDCDKTNALYKEIISLAIDENNEGEIPF